MIRVDRDSGVIMWAFQPVPFSMDDDPDWSAGAAVAPASCGERIVSVQKDGWAYALDPGGTTPSAPVVHGQFPPTGYPFSGPDMGVHGDFHYKMPAAIWNDVAIMVAGGELRMADGPTSGYGRLHALNICAGSEATRVRWLLDVPHATLGNGYTVGAPTVTGGIARAVGGDVRTVIDGERVDRAPEDLWVVPAGSSMRIEAINEYASIETIAIGPARPAARHRHRRKPAAQ